MQKLRILLAFIQDLYQQRALLWSLTKKDLRQRYLGSVLGILWAFIQPTISVLIFWFVFQVGFKSMPVAGFPFVLWLCCGMFPWFFFTDAWGSATNAIIANSFLVKKVVFRVSLLPIIQIMSALVVNLFFVGVLFLMFGIYGYPPSIYNVQVFYYLGAMICLVFGLSLMTSSLMVFLKDVGQFVSMFIQFGFWATPIFWNLEMIPQWLRWIFKINPVYYIVEGYRASFIYHRWFWELGFVNLSFWIETGAIMLLGAYLFKKLRPHFADVL
ncbi:ABC transporter permease [uncultured Selenomonas sp.]|uniref:ABC transporter permease n=1 Tax=uncultured Selenomonas sp. TaxID=159275 RepID=UPI0025F5D4BC|nr:ABC transporter permease [uncultured Selenomonas sp.]